jgi:hypothetical protein
MNERLRRRWAATEARSLGWGGVTAVAAATGLTRKTIHKGIREVEAEGVDPASVLPPERARRAGAGRKPIQQSQPGILAALELLVESTARGDPQSPLRWTCKSTRHLAEELTTQGYEVSHTLVAGLLHDLEYSLQANRKMLEGTAHPDRNAQFEHINEAVTTQLKRGQPAISVDTKKKELVGRFKNGGRTWRPQGNPEKVKVHDFLDPARGKAIPYGVYDLGRNLGWVSVGVDHDTATFAVATIRRWWRELGRKHYPRAKSLLITADSGGSNGSRLRLWKWELQKLARQTGLIISVCHLPPGTSKWNKIEHRLFSFISQNWRGQPLLSHAAIVSLIAGTKTKAGLKVRCVLDTHKYPKDLKLTAEQMTTVNLKPNKFHGDWNYAIVPRRNTK